MLVLTVPSPPEILKIEKPQGGQAITAEASYDGTIKIDFSAIANEKITLVHIGERLIILFDNQSTVTIIPFFDSMGVPLANITIESNGKEFTGAEFASTFPITTDQSVLPAAGDGTPASARISRTPASIRCSSPIRCRCSARKNCRRSMSPASKGRSITSMRSRVPARTIRSRSTKTTSTAPFSLGNR